MTSPAVRLPFPRRTVVGIDASLLGTGIAVVDLSEQRPVYSGTVKPKTKHIHERFELILDEIGMFTTQAALVMIEGVFVGKMKGDTALKLGGLHYLLRHYLWRGGVPFAVIAPRKRAKFATGNGNAGKTAVLEAVRGHYGYDLEIKDHNQADALVLAAMGSLHLNRPLVNIPRKNLEAMDGIDWPDNIEIAASVI